MLPMRSWQPRSLLSTKLPRSASAWERTSKRSRRAWATTSVSGGHFLDAGLGYGGSCFEADETVFTLNSPNVAVERFDTMFAKGGTPFQGDVVELVQPAINACLPLILKTGKPILAGVKAITRRPYKGTDGKNQHQAWGARYGLLLTIRSSCTLRLCIPPTPTSR